MGYAHYWQRQTDLPLDVFVSAVTDCRKICDVLAIPLGDSHGDVAQSANNVGLLYLDQGRYAAAEPLLNR